MNDMTDIQYKDNFEKEIENILNNVTKKEYLSLKNVNENRNAAIETIFNKFMNYEKNIENKKNIYKELKNYKVVMPEDLKKGDYIYYYNMKQFYNLKLKFGGKFCGFNTVGEILLSNKMYFKSIEPTICFVKLSGEDIIKMRLMDIIDNL